MLPWCDYESFHIILYDEKRRDGSCTNGKHSWRTYRRIECQSGECFNKCANVTNFIFYRVYPSLYSLTVLAYNKKNEFIDYRSKPVEIKTDYIRRSWRTDITYENPTFERDVVNFQVTFSPPTSDVTIYLIDEEDNNNDKISFKVFNSTVNAALQLKDSTGGHDTVMKVCSITQEKQDTRHKGNINRISCAYNASESIKKLEIHFTNEDLCDHSSRHIREAQCVCWQIERLDVKEKEIPPDSAKYKALYIFIYLTMALVIAGVIAVGITVAVLRGRQRMNLTATEVTSSNPLISKGIEILLLYARDCPDFMELMVSLKTFLEADYDIQVYDCFDMPNEVLDGPEEWFQKLIQRSGLRIIVVTTECACLLQKAYLTNIKGLYREPKFLDNFFMYALTHIKRDFSQDVYHKIYTVQISGFSDENELKFIPTSHARYKLPDHLGRLLNDMSVVRTDEVLIEIENFSSGEAYEDLKKSLKKLRLFKSENDRYLYQLLLLEEDDEGISTEEAR
ncbi:uncharacterized protein LOC124157407 isoform X2 [Ischnura elegans]|nr:uncharacterized protein LOC124157407 isoform X2 [Ischnura elegans]